MRLNVLTFIAFITVAGCTTGNSLEGQVNKQKTVMPQFTTGPATLVYKTKRDYSSFVRILLSEDKSRILSYPDPKDFKNAYPKPVKLKDGYLLDNGGIGLNTAYLNLTYAQYAALPKVPSQEALMKMIIDKDPFTELYNCGNRNAYKNLVDDLNTLIRSGQFKKVCRQMK